MGAWSPAALRRSHERRAVRAELLVTRDRVLEAVRGLVIAYSDNSDHIDKAQQEVITIGRLWLEAERKVEEQGGNGSAEANALEDVARAAREAAGALRGSALEIRVPNLDAALKRLDAARKAKR